MGADFKASPLAVLQRSATLNADVSETLIPQAVGIAHVWIMRIDRLFHVLVVHGSLLVAGCDEGGGTSEGGASADGEGPGDDGGGSSSTTGTSSATTPTDAGDANDDEAGDGGGSTEGGAASTDEGPASTDGGPVSTDEGPASTDDGAGGESSSGDAPELQCSDTPDPNDTCGCPCCWALDCINTEECCAGFTEFCTPAA